MRNITLSIEDELLEQGRRYAHEHNTSLNALVRRLLQGIVTRKDDRWFDEMFAVMDELKASSDSRWSRDELYRV